MPGACTHRMTSSAVTMFGIAIEQIGLQVHEKLLGADALPGKVIDIVAHEGVETFAAEFRLEEQKEEPPLLIRRPG